MKHSRSRVGLSALAILAATPIVVAAFAGSASAAQQAKEYVIPPGLDGPTGIVSGPDGHMWLTETKSNDIVTFEPQAHGSGKRWTVYMVPTTHSRPTGIAVGRDGELWFTETNANKIGVISVRGKFKQYTIPTADTHPNMITAGPDG